ncbi:multi-sensor hybrid histidine kinase [Halopseudomonas xinjiangensis]|uniref:histidine kinase n=1 Tax=Halopseudomonas xinjiangensis TaxID=487184 RepID=A0A1H1V5B3_9GAMM|nr:response regulator [Halopseudomonas xinjiangensis]SDS79902.1 multi-sensor hybrid histidine kinase [Halopseudomonas xinjiangensis]
MNDIGIKTRLLLMTLLPSGLLAIALGGYFSWQHLRVLDEQLLERGLMTVEYLQRPAASALLDDQPSRLRPLISEVLNHSDVRAVSLYNEDMRRLEHSGPKMHQAERTVPGQLGAGTGLQVQSGPRSSRFMLPLLASADLIEERDLANVETDALLGWLEVELSHGNLWILRYQTILSTLLLIIAGLIVTGAMVTLMGRRITDPVRQINLVIGKLSEGQLDQRLPPQGSRELNELADGINTMAETLQSAQGELQQNIDQATEDLRQTLETIEIQNIELDLARKTAQEASRIKSEFLANMSHELRTPLNGILGFSNLLQRTDLSNRQQEYLGTIEKSADNLLAIINEILDFSKIEAGKLVLDNLPFNLRDLIQDTLTMLAPAAHQKSLELVSIIYRDTPLGLSGDPLRLKQILANLISNAIKFTNQGSVSVRVMLEQEDEAHALLRISVTDTGIGLTPAQQKSLFQAFSQADNSLSRQSGGTGLGLVISKRLVEQMQGEIGLHSQPGEGSEFWLTLRLGKSSQARDDLPRKPLDGLRAALVEPQMLSRQAVLHNLEDLGFSVRTFESAQALHTSLLGSGNGRAESFDLVLLSTRHADCPAEDIFDMVRRWSERELCKTLLFTDTTEHYPMLDMLPRASCQVLSKPICTRKLFRAALHLLRPGTATPAPARVSSSEPKVSVLCVDDNLANLKLVEALLSDMGARVLTSTSGEDALDVMSREQVDLIFMDVQMPGMDGRQTTTELRQREDAADCPAVPIVALTAHALAGERRQLLKCGMNDYMSKPINPEQLRHCVQKWTGVTLDPLADSVPGTDIPGGTRPAPEAFQGPTKPSTSQQVLDRQEGLRLAAGKADLAADMLSMLIAGLPRERQQIEQARIDGDRNALLEAVHRLHGATRYCGVPELRACCNEAESLIKQNRDSEVAVEGILQAMDRLKQCYAALPS